MRASHRMEPGRCIAWPRILTLLVLVAAAPTAGSAQDFVVLHVFRFADGANPTAPLIQATDGYFFGTTRNGGEGTGVGTIFRIDSLGTLTTLYKFCSQTNCNDGFNPYAGLVQGNDGNFYGTTQDGGPGSNNSVDDGTL